MITRKRTSLVLVSACAVALASAWALHASAQADCQRICAPGTPKDARGCCQARARAPASKPTPKQEVEPEPTGVCPAGMAFLPAGLLRLKEQGDLVGVAPYCLDRTEVTTEAYATCVSFGACATADAHDFSGAPCNGATPGREKHPINCVEWVQASMYCLARGKRLPTEVEWEWAAQGATRRTTYPWGDAAPMAQLCWSGLSPRAETCAAGSFAAGNSPQGLSDLAGGVWEWTASRAESEDPDASFRIVRGGGWKETKPDEVNAGVRLTIVEAGSTETWLGFRCAASAAPAPGQAAYTPREVTYSATAILNRINKTVPNDEYEQRWLLHAGFVNAFAPMFDPSLLDHLKSCDKGDTWSGRLACLTSGMSWLGVGAIPLSRAQAVDVGASTCGVTKLWSERVPCLTAVVKLLNLPELDALVQHHCAGLPSAEQKARCLEQRLRQAAPAPPPAQP
jgi:formylglycine-generating enzyme required for sulfatase activity